MINVKDFIINPVELNNGDIIFSLSDNDLLIEMRYVKLIDNLKIEKITPGEEMYSIDYPFALTELLDIFTGQTEDGQDLLYVDINKSYLVGTKYENYLIVKTPKEILDPVVNELDNLI